MSARATGFGYNGRIAQPCDRGFWNLADSYGTCKACGYGLTTAAVGAGKKEADCGLAAGFGNNGGTVGPCPAGVFLLLEVTDTSICCTSATHVACLQYMQHVMRDQSCTVVSCVLLDPQTLV